MTGYPLVVIQEKHKLRSIKNTVGKVGFYCLDQNRETTSSLGIYNYTRHLIHSLAEIDHPGFELIVWLSEGNRSDFHPAEAPPWMTVRCLQGPGHSVGMRRLWADHVLARRLSGHDGIEVMHYPKGWIPIQSPAGVKTIVTLHDVFIPFPRFPIRHFLKLLGYWYFQAMIGHSLSKADRIITDSQYSAREIRRRNPRTSDKLFVSYPGPGICLAEGSPSKGRCRTANSRLGPFIVIGSQETHKFTAETIRLISYWAAKNEVTPEVTVVSLPRWEPAFGNLPENLQLNFTGRISDSQFELLIQQSRILFYLSLIEGFGMPAVEAYYFHTPVCYRTGTAVEEVLMGAKGGWDGNDAEGFCHAVEAVLAMTDEEIAAIRQEIVARYNWKQCAQRMATAYRAMLQSHGSPSI